MTLPRIKRIAWLMTATMIAASLLVIIAGAMMPYDIESPDFAPVATKMDPKAKRPAAQALTLVDYQAYLNSGLRKPLPKSPPPAPPPVVAIVQPAEMAMQLVGTVTEAAHSYAVFRTSDGIELKRIGQAVAGATITEIDEGVVHLRQPHGEIATLRVPQPRSP